MNEPTDRAPRTGCAVCPATRALEDAARAMRGISDLVATTESHLEVARAEIGRCSPTLVLRE